MTVAIIGLIAAIYKFVAAPTGGPAACPAMGQEAGTAGRPSSRRWPSERVPVAASQRDVGRPRK
jgi:hypothetical protein